MKGKTYSRHIQRVGHLIPDTQLKIVGFMLFSVGPKNSTRIFYWLFISKCINFQHNKKETPRRDLTGHDECIYFNSSSLLNFFLSQGPIIHS